MAERNGSGNDEHDDEVTPNELPRATLDEHKPYVKALTAVIAPLHATVLMLADVLHELRVAREPASRLLIGQLAEAGRTIEGVGHTLATEFGRP